jgi:hypothetical protein
MLHFPLFILPQARVTDVAKLEGKLDSENGARKSEIAALDGWAKGENDARKNEIENLNNFARYVTEIDTECLTKKICKYILFLVFA